MPTTLQPILYIWQQQVPPDRRAQPQGLPKALGPTAGGGRDLGDSTRTSEALGMEGCHFLCQRSHRPGSGTEGSSVSSQSVTRASPHPALRQVDLKVPPEEWSFFPPAVRVSGNFLERVLSLLHYCHGCLRNQNKFPELPDITLNFAP